MFQFKQFNHDENGTSWVCFSRSARKDLATRDAKILRKNWRVKIEKKTKYYYVFITSKKKHDYKSSYGARLAGRILEG